MLTIIAWNKPIGVLTGIPKEAMIGKGDHEYSLPFFKERRKNLVDISGKPLIAYSIEHALESKLINRVIVSTEDEEIATISKE